MNIIHTNVLVLGSGTAGSNAARAAVKASAQKVTIIQPRELINTCVEEGCMPSKSILAGAHQNLPLEQVIIDRDAHIDRLKKALTDGLATEAFEIVLGNAVFIDNKTVIVTDNGVQTHYTADSIIIATGSRPFVPPIEGLDTIGDALLISDDVVSKKAQITEVPKRVLTIGGGPIGLELSTFFHDMGSKVLVLQRKAALTPFDPEFGDERVRASKDPASFPIELNANLVKVEKHDGAVFCHIECNGDIRVEQYDAVLVATGRRANTDTIGLDTTDVVLDARGGIEHGTDMQTSVPSIFIAGDVTGHHQILHFAAEMGKIAGHNATNPEEREQMDYDRHMLAVSFDQFPSALIGLTEKEAVERGMDVISATKEFKSIGLGILKRQEYGLWKVVADAKTGEILGSQILGPDSSGELIQILVPILANGNTAEHILHMTWYHPTYAEILKSIARDLNAKRKG
ncbi:MAG: pyruvate/2-oxoglutarate dehydrogenase complex dihydrolipoamide dehydrogenase (E3) component [Patiriisocius sp.]|jgi:pyruvate/2-oxoglutarate dehydrogenase complex dihydrolipoamide dehydrogenase (E3) component